MSLLAIWALFLAAVRTDFAGESSSSDPTAKAAARPVAVSESARARAEGASSSSSEPSRPTSP